MIKTNSRPDFLINRRLAKSKPQNYKKIILGPRNLTISRRSQVTIFVILAIIILAIIAMVFIFRGSSIIPGISGRMPNIQLEMQSCTKTAVLQAVEIMLPQGGYLKPENYKIYNNNNVGYLCYNKNYYSPCINQEPDYISHLTGEIKSYISGKIEDCFYKIQQDYQSKGYSVSMGATSLTIALNPKQVEVIIDKKIDINKQEESINYNRIIYKIETPIYDLGIIAGEIVNGEAKDCDFDYFDFSKNYPKFKISRTFTNDNTRIYLVDEKLQFATRSCALPGGY